MQVSDLHLNHWEGFVDAGKLEDIMHFYVVGVTVSQTLYRNTYSFRVTHTYILLINSIADKLVCSHQKRFQGS